MFCRHCLSFTNDMFPCWCEFSGPAMATPEHDTWLCVPTANSLFFLLSHYILFPPPSGIKGCLNTSLQYIMLPVKTGKRQGLSGSLCLVKKEKKKNWLWILVLFIWENCQWCSDSQSFNVGLVLFYSKG